MNYRREIDGLRALAVVPVILFHIGFQAFSGGFVGVDVFFVISGYLITTIIIGELEQGKFSIINFYERRARRILPVLFVVMLLCLPVAWLWLIPIEMRSFSQSLVAVSAFASNILFWKTSGYFDTAAELKPLLHTWSLAVEEQYYVFFPVFLMMAWKFGKRWIVATLVIIFVGSLAMAQWASVKFPMMAFFLLPTRVWELLVGAFVAFYFTHPGRKPLVSWVNEVVGLVGMALVTYAIFAFDKKIPFPSLYALIPTVGAALIILCANQHTVAGKILGNRVFVGIGLVSYSAYLWHQPLLAFYRNKSLGETSHMVMLAIAVLTFVLSYFSWKFIETPFRNKSRYGRKFIFISAIIGTVFFASFGLAGHFTNGFANRAMALPFKPFEYDTEKLGYRKCDAPALLAGEPINYCYQTAESDKIDAVLIGDSHADDKFYGIQKNSSVLKWALVGNSSCPPLLDVDVIGDQTGCMAKFEKIIPWIEQSKSIKTVVLSFYGNYASTTNYAADHVNRNVGTLVSKEHLQLSRTDLFYLGLKQSVHDLLAAGKQVVVVVDIPELPFFPVDCVKGKPNCQIPLQEVLERQSVHRASLEKLKREFPQVNIYDPLALFCSQQNCTYRTLDKILYRDSHHLTLDGSDMYGRKFDEWLSALPK